MLPCENAWFIPYRAYSNTPAFAMCIVHITACWPAGSADTQTVWFRVASSASVHCLTAVSVATTGAAQSDAGRPADLLHRPAGVRLRAAAQPAGRLRPPARDVPVQVRAAPPPVTVTLQAGAAAALQVRAAPPPVTVTLLAGAAAALQVRQSHRGGSRCRERTLTPVEEPAAALREGVVAVESGVMAEWRRTCCRASW